MMPRVVIQSSYHPVHNPQIRGILHYLMGVDLRTTLEALTRDELRTVARKLKVKGYRRRTKPFLILEILTRPQRAIQNALSLSVWDRFWTHFYGILSILLAAIGLFLTIVFFLFPREALFKPKTTETTPQVTTGIAMWKLRPSIQADARGIRLLEHNAAGIQPEEFIEWTPVRAAITEAVRPGDRVMMTVTSSRSGFLYIVDQERYADNTLSSPRLIYPTLRMGNGNNQIGPGRLIAIPAMTDSPSYLTVKRSRNNQLGERLTLLLAIDPIHWPISSAPLILMPSELTDIESQGEEATVSLRNRAGTGLAATEAQMNAARFGSTFQSPEYQPELLYSSKSLHRLQIVTVDVTFR